MRSHPTVHTQRFTLLRCGINTSNIYLIMIITTLQYKQSLPNNRASAQPRSPYSGFGKPPIPLYWSSLLHIQRLRFSVTQQGRVSPITRKGLTLLPGLVRRPQHLPLGCQPWSPERSTHDSLSIYRNAGLFRARQTSLPDSTAQRMRPNGQTNFSPITCTSS